MTDFDPKAFLETLPMLPGVYKMIDKGGHVLYVGKARRLKNRVANYFRSPQQLDPKTQTLMAQVQRVEITIASSENEALLLESTLIKSLRPRYNILLKDDKSYPYLFLSAHADFPSLQSHRGVQREQGEYFGPYTSARAVYETLDFLQKLFKIRQCSDVFFKNRTRPCLQYQIKRCTAPCVNYIDAASYQEDVKYVRLFLQGKNEAVIQALVQKMEKAANELAFEVAARLRDQIKNLRQIQERQAIKARIKDLDLIAFMTRAGVICVEVLSIRGGTWMGSHAYFPRVQEVVSEEDAFSSFLSQYYLHGARGKSFPQRIYINHTLKDSSWLEAAFSEQWGRKITIAEPQRVESKKWLQLAILNAKQALDSYLSSQLLYGNALQTLQVELKLTDLPQRFECFDISHTQGEATVASCVVFGKEGPVKENYRRFNIKDVTAGDDYAAMQQALTRHYTHLKMEGKKMPDILIIDGGKGQLAQAESVLKELQIVGIQLMGIAKGVTRKAGLETIFLAGHQQPFVFATDSPALHLLQRIRDEAHRFAITGHRKQRAKTRNTSSLEKIPGVGAKRRRELLRFFGGLQGVANASVAELAKVPGISQNLAQRLYDALHT
jgi:excinuclease ABC subunit C